MNLSREDLQAGIDESLATLSRLRDDHALLDAVSRLHAACLDTLRAGGKILLCGNGGSAADAQHWAAELVARFNYDRPGLAAIALTTDTSALTAIGNDYGYEQVFSRQVEALARKGDLLIAISTSGNSPNVLRAIAAARALGVTVAGFTGAQGGRMNDCCDLLVRVPSSRTPQIQEGHAVIGHLLCGAIEASMHPRVG